MLFARGYSESTIRTYQSLLLRFMKELRLEDVLRPQKLKVMSREEIVSLIRAAGNSKHRAMLELIYSAGLRCGERINLQAGDVQLASGQIRIRSGKGGKDWVALLSGRAVALLKVYQEQYQPKEFLFEGQEILFPIPFTASGTGLLLIF